jgi:hypothetical protein
MNFATSSGSCILISSLPVKYIFNESICNGAKKKKKEVGEFFFLSLLYFWFPIVFENGSRFECFSSVFTFGFL